MSAEYKKILDLRRMIPSVKGCPKGCHNCCGIVPFSSAEWSRIKDKRKGERIDHCPYAGEDGCDIYSDRPILCRLFGTSGFSQERRCGLHARLTEVKVINVRDQEKYIQAIFYQYHLILERTGIHGPFAEELVKIAAIAKGERSHGLESQSN